MMMPKEVVMIMAKQGKHDCRRLILACKAHMGAFLAHRLGTADPLVLMEEGGQKPGMSHLRLSIRWAVEQGEPIIPPMPQSVFYMESIQQFRDVYREKLKGKLALARGPNLSEARFTFHLVRRLVLSTATKNEKAYYQRKAEKHGGEAEIHQFITFPTVHTLLFAC